MLKYDILAISVSNLAELGPIFYPLGHMFPVRLIMSGVLDGRRDKCNDTVVEEALKTRLLTITFSGQNQARNAIFAQALWTDGRTDPLTEMRS